MRYSVVIPLKDEAENISELIAEIEPVMHSLREPFEILCIDDGSSDETFSILCQLKEEKPYLKVIQFDRNYGQSSAFAIGFQSSKGDFVITLDGDRQNNPCDIPKLLEHTHEADLVCGERMKRKDTFWKRSISKVANSIRSRLCNDGVPDTGCSLKIYRRSCLNQLKMYQGMHRFLPALFQIEGFRVKSVPVSHRKREKGKTKYNIFNRSFNTIIDMFAVRWMRKRHLNYKIKEQI